MMSDYIDIETMSFWLVNYGSITLFILLALGIIALPVPEETLLTITGILLYKGLLNMPLTYIAALGGSMCGITVSYIIGKTIGSRFLHKYGSWAGLTEKRLQMTHNWFDKYGKWSLTIGYFIPGVRHFTGVIAGVTELEYGYFALFAYSGAVVWVTTFLSLGYFFGDYWISLMNVIEESVLNVIIAISVVVALFFLYRYFKKPKKKKLQ
jgi:membrane protein DedA with SNARE-associated domain